MELIVPGTMRMTLFDIEKVKWLNRKGQMLIFPKQCFFMYQNCIPDV